MSELWIKPDDVNAMIEHRNNCACDSDYSIDPACVVAYQVRIQGVVVPAADCHPERPHRARGLCRQCYEHAYNNGTLEQHQPRATTRHRDTFLADYRMLRNDGYTNLTDIARRMGMTRSGVAQAIRRAVKAGELEPQRRQP